MIFREASDEDIPAIVALLKSSLGEERMPKTEEYWRWKHVHNPFGSSPVLLAVDNDRIAGVRAFMRWRWSDGVEDIEAVRAVDTATHPEYQGKGIFKKLTLQLLKNCSNYGISFVYNTPNKNSFPGYMKMGWRMAGKIPVEIRLVNPIRVASGLFLKQGEHEAQGHSSVKDLLVRPDAALLIGQSQKKTKGCYQTFHTVDSLLWRYHHVPVTVYDAAAVEEEGRLDALCFYRFKMSRFGKEMRITDTFASDASAILKLKNKIFGLARQHQVAYITTQPDLIKLSGVSVTVSGPMVTVRDMGSNADFVAKNFVGFKNWSPSLGDLELF